MTKFKYLALHSKLFVMLLLLVIANNAFSDEAVSEAQPPPEIVVDAPPPTTSPVKNNSGKTETITTIESKVLPGFRPCTTEDYRNQDTDPIACQDEEAARIISTREPNHHNADLIVEDDTVPQGNIFKLKFERFKKKK